MQHLHLNCIHIALAVGDGIAQIVLGFFHSNWIYALTFPPALSRRFANTMDGASRMSSVFGLNTIPEGNGLALKLAAEVGVYFIEQHTLLIVVHCLNSFEDAHGVSVLGPYAPMLLHLLETRASIPNTRVDELVTNSWI